MMREILFRGKQKYSGKWVYGSFFSPNAIMKRGKEFDADKTYTILPETVGQFTGLTDRNGKKIFEGDIISIPFEEDRYPYEEAVIHYENAEVYFDTEHRGWYVRYSNDDALSIWEYNDSDITVIGNIHDNPELLKGDKDND